MAPARAWLPAAAVAAAKIQAAQGQFACSTKLAVIVKSTVPDVDCCLVVKRLLGAEVPAGAADLTAHRRGCIKRSAARTHLQWLLELVLAQPLHCVGCNCLCQLTVIKLHGSKTGGAQSRWDEVIVGQRNRAFSQLLPLPEEHAATCRDVLTVAW